jgi:hypothetical protein
MFKEFQEIYGSLCHLLNVAYSCASLLADMQKRPKLRSKIYSRPLGFISEQTAAGSPISRPSKIHSQIDVRNNSRFSGANENDEDITIIQLRPDHEVTAAASHSTPSYSRGHFLPGRDKTHSHVTTLYNDTTRYILVLKNLLNSASTISLMKSINHIFARYTGPILGKSFHSSTTCGFGNGRG